MMKKNITLFIILFFISTIVAQSANRYKDYYRVPMNIPLILSGNFAETRTNHFHSGLDIRTGGVEGEPLYAVADGYIARVGVVPTGFGRVLYIAHPNGTTTIYAHMQWFADDIEKYVSAERHRLQLHRVDLYPPADKFMVKKGDFIGLSGNSGSSAGPHLHFEIRDTPSQRTLNVAKLGVYSITDNIKPRIVNIYCVETDTINGVPYHSRPQAVGVSQTSDGQYTISSGQPLIIGPRTHFILEATDRKNDTHNTFGIYSVEAKLDGNRFFSFKLDDFLFSQTRYVNSLSDYSMQRGSRNELLRLALQAGNKLPIYNGVVNRGVVMLNDDNEHKIEIVVEDDSDNISRLTFNVKRRAQSINATVDGSSLGVPIDYKRSYSRSGDGVEVEIPANSLYESIFYNQSIQSLEEALGGKAAGMPYYSSLYNLHNDETPLHTSISIAITPENVPVEFRSKLCMASLGRNGKLSHAGGRYEGGKVVLSTRSFGRYCVVADTIPPTISGAFANGVNLRGVKSVSFNITDDFSGVSSYSATIDGKWIPFEQKGTKITHYFDSSRIEYTGGTHTLRLTVIDSKGNATVLTRTFTR